MTGFLFSSPSSSYKKMLTLFSVLLAAAMVVQGQYTVKPSTLSLLTPRGLRMTYPNEAGVTLYAVHYNINKPTDGVAGADHNYDVTAPTGNVFIHENTMVDVKPGDIVYYWTYVIYNGLGYQLIDQSWVATTGADGTTTTSTAAPSTTRTSTVRPATTSRPPGQSTNAPPRKRQFGKSKCARASRSKAITMPPEDCTSYPCLIFDEEFDTLDLDTWQHEITASGGGNWEFQYYTNNRSNSYVKNGALYIKPTLTSDKYGEAFLTSGTLDIWGATPANLCTGNSFYGCTRVGNPTNIINPIQSARIRTAESFSFRYGRLEVEAQMPRGDWLWPAIWLLPVDEFYGVWPASGEIDLVESRGNGDLHDPGSGESRGHDHVGQTLHWGPFFPANGFELTNEAKTGGSYGTAYHKYRLDWNPSSITMFIDDEVVMHVEPTDNGFWEHGNFGQSLPGAENPWKYGENKMSPFDKEFHFIINLAVGGTNGFFSDNWVNQPYPKPWLNTSPQAFLDFYRAKGSWYPTWNPTNNDGEDAALKVNYVKVWKLEP